jgi:hypothetical protein
MSWVRFRVGRGTLKIKPRSQMRSFETEGKVPSINFGFFIISWWSDAAQQRYDGGHVATRLANVPDAEAFTPPSVEKRRSDEARMHIPPPVIKRVTEKTDAGGPQL